MSQNRFDAYYDIRQAIVDDIPDIMSFIDAHWKKGHILAVNRAFFEYEMTDGENVNFIIAKVKSSGVIDGILGFLPCSSSTEKLDAWGVIWKTKDNALPMLGIELKKRFFTITGARNDLGTGANFSTSVPLLSRIMHYYTSKMKHYYRLNDIESYTIAKVSHRDIPPYADSHEITVEIIPSSEKLESFFDFSSMHDSLPYKDLWYYKKRFYNHPIYKYQVWGVKGTKSKAFFVTRVQEYEEAKIVSIVDYYGDCSLFSQCGSFFDQLLKNGNYEYIDFYFDGFDEDLVKSAGFVMLTDNDTNIIPTYFNPFLLSNIDIYVIASNKNEKFMFFKADGDQDRPS